MTEINGKIYCGTNLVNGKKYIGQTIGDLKRRIKRHESVDGCVYIYRAIKKYGANNFEWVVIDTADNMDDLNAKEIYWIKELNFRGEVREVNRERLIKIKISIYI